MVIARVGQAFRHCPSLISASNLEWIFGYGPRFGVTYVDRDDGCKRYPKGSAYMLRDIFKHAIRPA